MSNKLRPQSGIFDVEGEIRQNGQPLVIRDQALVLSECAVYATSLIDGSTEPKVVAIDTSVSPAYDLTTGLLKAKIMTSLLSEEVLGVAVNNISLNNTGTLITRGIITSTLTGSSVGQIVYTSSTGTLTTTLSAKKIGYILTTGTNAKVFVDIKVQNLEYINDLLSGAAISPPGMVAPYLGGSAPSGWLMCDGNQYSTTAPYDQLFSVIGYAFGGSGANFNVPNYQGMFLRGIGSQTIGGVNYGGPIAIFPPQQDQFQGHYHTTNAGISSSGGGFGSFSANATAATVTNPITDGTNGTPRTGNETRPVNYGVNYIIKL